MYPLSVARNTVADLHMALNNGEMQQYLDQHLCIRFAVCNGLCCYAVLCAVLVLEQVHANTSTPVQHLWVAIVELVSHKAG